MNLEDVLIPIVFFGVTFGIVYIVLMFRHRNRKMAQQTLLAAIEKGQQLDAAIVQTLVGSPPSSGDRDVRRGVVLLAAGLATGGLAILIDDPDATPVIFGAALFPLLIGAAYLAMVRLKPRAA